MWRLGGIECGIQRRGDEVMREGVAEAGGTAVLAHDAALEQLVDGGQARRAARARRAASDIGVEGVAADRGHRGDPARLGR